MDKSKLREAIYQTHLVTIRSSNNPGTIIKAIKAMAMFDCKDMTTISHFAHKICTDIPNILQQRPERLQRAIIDRVIQIDKKEKDKSLLSVLFRAIVKLPSITTDELYSILAFEMNDLGPKYLAITALHRKGIDGDSIIAHFREVGNLEIIPFLEQYAHTDQL